MSPAGGLQHAAAFVYLVETGEGIGLQRAAELAQMLLRMFTTAIRRVSKPHGRSLLAGGRTIIANIGPQPPRLRLALPRSQHRNRSVVAMHLACGEYIAAQRGNERFQQAAGLAHPGGQRRAIQINAFAGVDLMLAIQRKVVTVLRGENVCEQSRPSQATLDGAGRRGCLHNRVAAAAAQLGTNMTDDDEAGWNVVEYFRDVLTQFAQCAATLRARPLRRFVHPGDAP